MRPKILIVEDEPAIADTIHYALETDGCDPVVVSAGAPALDMVRQEKIDLIVLDVGLPDMSGFDLCKRLRRHATIPIIFLTARSDEIDRVVGLEIGGDDYVVKPFSPRELTARVKAVLRRSRPGRSKDTEPGIFEVNIEKRQIIYCNTVLELSRYEYDLLATFIRRPGVVFTREQLMDRVWEAPEASMDRTVDAHIKNLRAKLKAVRPEPDPIVTHRGTGYALREDL
ncbi:MAG: two-component system response regulator CreB [Desulfatitalea sp.]|nr:two-component system response regulator CreB [Desulfatitalea sp.]NNJ99914.1 two-component system response regulator CreB [Desulfatitalea sp.]